LRGAWARRLHGAWSDDAVDFHETACIAQRAFDALGITGPHVRSTWRCSSSATRKRNDPHRLKAGRFSNTSRDVNVVVFIAIRRRERRHQSV
jgi:hypothetical protein